MTKYIAICWVVLSLAGCGVEPYMTKDIPCAASDCDSDTDTDADTDTDTDSDSDSDSDSDTDTDTDSDSDTDTDTDTDVCEDGDAECDGDVAMNCVDGAWVETECDSDEICAIIEGEATCYNSDACDEDAIYCDGETLMECVEGEAPSVVTECAVLELFCNADLGACVECDADHECADGYECVENECVLSTICVAGAEQCNDDGNVETCNSTGTAWVVTDNCSSTEECVEDGDSAACESIVICEAGAEQCSEAGNVQTCNSAGTAWTTTDFCSTTESCVESGDTASCVSDAECDAGESMCDDNVAMNCSTSGSWVATTCDTDEICKIVSSDAVCVALECGAFNDYDCPEGESCVEGECVSDDVDECVPGDPDHQCPAGYACLDTGVCVISECTSASDCASDEVCYILGTRFERVDGELQGYKIDGVCGTPPSSVAQCWDRDHDGLSSTIGGTCELFYSEYSPDLWESDEATPHCQGSSWHYPVPECCVRNTMGKCTNNTVEFGDSSYLSSSWIDRV